MDTDLHGSGLRDRRVGRLTPQSALGVLVISGVLGFVVGSVAFPTWQVAVETAQVVAGIVKYPADNPFYLYHTKLWTVIHEIAALLLRAGVSEIQLSKLLSGVLGMMSFQAISMVVYAFSFDALLALGTPFFIFVTRAANHGAIYPIALMGTDHTYGVIGLSAALLVVALLGTGCYRFGGFLLGMAPSLHASLGAWLMLIVALAFVWDFKRLRGESGPGWKYFLAGCAFTGVSVGVHLIMTSDGTRLDPGVASRYVSAFITGWDRHRMAAPIVSVGTIVNACVLLLTLLWLGPYGREVPRPAAFALRAFGVSAALSLLLMFVSWVPPDKVPTALLVLMPARYLNLNTLAFVPLVLGLLGIYRRRTSSRFATAAFVLALFFSYSSMLWDLYPGKVWFLRDLRINPWHVFVAASSVLIGLGGVSAWQTRRSGAETSAAPAARPWSRGGPISGAARGLTLGVLAVSAVATWRLSSPTVFRDRTNDPFFAAVAAEPQGVVLTGGSFHLVQLYTRRPVLLDGGALDTVSYAPEAGPATERILRDVYGIDYFNPPRAVTGAFIPHSITKPVWEGTSREKWRAIGRTYGVRQVLTRAGWTLDLPMTAETGSLRLFRIPD